MRGRHLGYVVDLGVDLATDPTALEWLRLLPIAGTVKDTVPAAAGWSLLRRDPARRRGLGQPRRGSRHCPVPGRRNPA